MVALALGVVSVAVFSEGTGEPTVSSFKKTLIQASEDVAPAVVNVRVVQLTYDMFLNVVPQEGLGSGIILSKEGYILTNEQVIHKAKEIKVLLPDGRDALREDE